ncbi:DUF4173 domain-containing protein, partial [Micromonospora phytophila]|uniref:DUF4173 domain-containing protein n=1 Tax=Micromonospora phytophila TaxID=709888 RepID=UPI0027E2A0C3
VAALSAVGALTTVATARPRVTPPPVVAGLSAHPTSPVPGNAAGRQSAPVAPPAAAPPADRTAPAAVTTNPQVGAAVRPGDTRAPGHSNPSAGGANRPAAAGAPGNTKPPVGGTDRPGATGAPGRAVRLVWTTATIALVAVGSVRAAGWLFALCLIAATATATLAVTGGRTPIGMLASAVLPPLAAVRALPWAVRGLARTRPGGPGVGRSLASVAVSIGLLALFGLLFSSADAIFADLLADLLPDVSSSGVIGWVLRFLLVGAGLLGGAYLLTRPPDLDGLHPAPARPVRRLEWALPLALLDLLFAAFVLVQLTVLFGGSGHVLRTAGLSYAQYARSGFWQLLAVSALTLLVIAGAARWAPRGTRADRLLIRLLLGTLTLLSLVVVASALYRMNVYADAYGATRLRLVVATVELWLGLLFVLVGVAAIRLRARWLPRLVLGTAVLALLGLAGADPDRLIAERNVDRYQQSGRLDVGYVAGLSADAVPALDRLPEPLRSCALRDIAAELPDDGVRTANLGRSRARGLLDADAAEVGARDCPGLRRW